MTEQRLNPPEGPHCGDAPRDAYGQAETAPPRAPTTPTFRMLRAFAFDPLLSNQLDTLGINRVTLPVLWEEGLAPGPVGEYLEVVDCDPAGGCFYEPVDLNNPHLLATDGLAPSEGNPQFHQQMVYAVAMTTIDHFEKALGRKALWSPRPGNQSPSGHEEFVPRLRIYPHALREANAYYSPEKKALLFGYFPASESAPGRNLPGGMVFTCLSHDIIAHETTHALLDGMHHRFIEPSNPDTFAIHEAFADVVALFQHFTFPEVLRHQIARTQGDLALESLLGQLAQQFGEAVGNYGALRDALGSVDPQTGRWKPRAPDPQAYQKTTEPHARGAILVAAVFDAFVSIYKSRVADLIRIASGGSGVLPAGNLHPDLVNRLAAEAAKAASHVLTMCVRALDYCPPVDVTFGEYLRALITADADLVDDDDLGYRVAMTEAFRRRGLYPPGVRSLGADSLVWERADEVLTLDGWFGPRNPRVKDLLQELNNWNLSARRERVFIQTCMLRAFLHQWFAQLRDETDPEELQNLTGLALTASAPWSIGRSVDGLPKFEIHAARPARRVGPDGQLMPTFILEITQKRTGFYDPARQEQADGGKLPAGTTEDFTFRGGATILFDLDTAAPRYFVRKSILSGSRLRRQREFLSSPAGVSLRATYFQSSGDEPFAFIHRGC